MKAVVSRWALGALLVAGGSALAQVPTNFGAERERLARESAAVEARFAERQAACQTRFAVTDCVNDAKKERREALTPLRRQANSLDDAQRKQRAAERLANVQGKEGGAQARGREVVVREVPAAAREAASAPAQSASAVREVKQRSAPMRVTAHLPPPVQPEAERRAKEAASQAQIEARKEAARAHREAAERRNAQRAVGGKRSAPLPTPASAAAP